MLLAAAAAVAVVAVAGGGFLAGKLTSSSGTQAQSRTTSSGSAQASGTTTPASGTASVSPSGSASGAATPSGAATGSVAAQVPANILTCPTDATSELWGCLTQAKLSNGALTLAFTADFTLTAGQDAGSHHFHLFLANPNPQGGTVPPDTIMRHVPNAGSWFNIYDNTVKVINSGTEQGGQKLGLQTDKFSLLCVRVASGLHELATDRKGGLATGNCVKITS